MPTSEPAACDPFHTIGDVTLGTVVAAGQAVDGTIYVVDETGASRYHVYTSGDQVLYRSGAALSGSSPDFLVYSLRDQDPVFTLQIDLVNGVPSAMGVVLGPIDTKTFTIGEQGEVLTMLPTSQVTSMPARDLAPASKLVYDTRLPDGRAFTVLLPNTDDSSYTDYRVFFGTQDRVMERPLRGIVQVMRNSYTSIPFDVDGVLATAQFTTETDGGLQQSSGTIVLGTDTFPLTFVPNANAAQGLSFFCMGLP